MSQEGVVSVRVRSQPGVKAATVTSACNVNYEVHWYIVTLIDREPTTFTHNSLHAKYNLIMT